MTCYVMGYSLSHMPFLQPYASLAWSQFMHKINTDSTMFSNETNSSKILPKLKQKQTTVNNIGVIYILRSILSRYSLFF